MTKLGLSQYPHLLPVLERIDAAEALHPPSPWSAPFFQPIGGLESVGFAPGSELFLVVSVSGRGVFDLASNQRIARDYDDDNLAWEDHRLLATEGIGPLAGERIRVAGLFGGGLPQTTPDGWSLEHFGHHWPDETILLVPPAASPYDLDGPDPAFYKLETPISQVRAAGFSSTGRTLVIATASDFVAYRRRAVSDPP